MRGKIAGLFACLLMTAVMSACGPDLAPLPKIDGVIEKAAAGEEEALGLLVRYFSSPVEDEPVRAFKALIEAKEKSVNYLIEALDDGDTVTAESAAGALGNIKDPRAVKPLIRVLGRPDFPAYAGIWALGEIGSEEAVPYLVDYLGNDNQEIRKYATRALIKFGGRAVPAVIESLGDPNPHARRYAARVLGQSGDPRAIEPLMSGYRSLDPEVGLWALGRLGDSRAFPLIAAEMDDGDWKIRLAAVQSLGALEDKRGVPLLTAALEDPEWVVREWAARGLEHITGERWLYRDQYGKDVVPYNLYR